MIDTSDVLSDVLGAVHLKGAVFFDFDLTAPWVAEAPPSSEIAGLVMPGAQRVIEYHLLARGSCWAGPVGQPAMQLHEGDLVLFPHGDGHVLSSAPGMRAATDRAMYVRRETALPLIYDLGGGQADTRIVCCFLGLDERPFNPVLSALPQVIHISASEPGAVNGRLESLFAMAVGEARSDRPGRENVLGRLSELIFVETIRRYVETRPLTANGWLAGLQDPVVGKAVAALHRTPADAWTVERLARTVGVSRSILAERFAAMVGHTPMHYLALWRMQLASRLLAEGRGIAAVAEAIGYESEAAFSRTFKKIVGQSPGAWRHRA